MATDNDNNEKVLYATALTDSNRVADYPGTTATPCTNDQVQVYATCVVALNIFLSHLIEQSRQQNMPGQGTRYDDRGNVVLVHQPGTAAPIYAQNAQGICDCFSNLWPSCGCTCCCHGAWILAQVAQKTQYSSFGAIFIPYTISWIVCIVIAIIYGPIFMIFPGIAIIFANIMIRLHFVKVFNIDSGGPFVECMIGFCCCCCSIAQMARHVGGYKKVLDGDLDTSMKDYFNEP